jgi:hypothetical protein
MLDLQHGTNWHIISNGLKQFYQAKLKTEELLVDEMLAVCDEISTWQEKRVGQEAREKYNAYFFGKQYWFHIKGFFIGETLTLAVYVLAGLVVQFVL